MEEHSIDLLVGNNPSLCIPRVFNNVDEKNIREVFEKLSLGQIKRIDILEKRNEKESFKRVFIHFNKWFNNEQANEVKRRLACGKDFKIVYDMPWYWKVSMSKMIDHTTVKKR